MSVIFNPSGQLDIATDPSDLPGQTDGKTETSDALTRCKNLHLDQHGKAKTRRGSKIVGSNSGQAINHVVVQGGVRYSFGGGEIFRSESSLISGLTDADWSTILYNAFNDTTQQVYALNGTDRKRVEGSSVYEWGLDAPTDTPNVTDIDGGSLSGDYSIKYTLAGKSGTTVVRESNPSSASNTATIASAVLGTFDRPNDSQVTHVRVYRTAAGGSTYTLSQDYAVPYKSDEDYVYTFSWEDGQNYLTGTGNGYTTTSGNNEYIFSWESDYSADTNIYFGVEQWTWEPVIYIGYDSDGSLSGSIPSTNTRPPAGTYVLGPSFNGTCFIIKDNLLYYCPAKQPEYWPSTYFIEVSPPQFPGKTAVFHNGQPYFITSNEIYYIQGTGHGTFFPLPMSAKTGAPNVQGAVSVRGHGIFHIGGDGLYLFSGEDKKFTQKNLDPIFSGESINGIPAIDRISDAWIFHRGSKLYFGYAGDGDTYPTNVLVFNLENKKICYYSYGRNILSITEDDTNDKIIVGCSDGYNRRIESATDTDDDGTAIDWDIQSKDFTLQTRFMFPRWSKYDIDASSASSCTGKVLLDGSTHQSHTITGNRNTNRRLIDTGNGKRLAHQITGSGPVTIYLVESE